MLVGRGATGRNARATLLVGPAFLPGPSGTGRNAGATFFSRTRLRKHFQHLPVMMVESPARRPPPRRGRACRPSLSIQELIHAPRQLLMIVWIVHDVPLVGRFVQ